MTATKRLETLVAWMIDTINRLFDIKNEFTPRTEIIRKTIFHTNEKIAFIFDNKKFIYLKI